MSGGPAKRGAEEPPPDHSVQKRKTGGENPQASYYLDLRECPDWLQEAIRLVVKHPERSETQPSRQELQKLSAMYVNNRKVLNSPNAKEIFFWDPQDERVKTWVEICVVHPVTNRTLATFSPATPNNNLEYEGNVAIMMSVTEYVKAVNMDVMWKEQGIHVHSETMNVGNALRSNNELTKVYEMYLRNSSNVQFKFTIHAEAENVDLIPQELTVHLSGHKLQDDGATFNIMNCITGIVLGSAHQMSPGDRRYDQFMSKGQNMQYQECKTLEDGVMHISYSIPTDTIKSIMIRLVKKESSEVFRTPLEPCKLETKLLVQDFLGNLSLMQVHHTFYFDVQQAGEAYAMAFSVKQDDGTLGPLQFVVFHLKK